MEAKALICDEKQSFKIEDVILPAPEADQIAIETHFTGISIGTEFALIRGKVSWGSYPICTGYMGTGIVTEVGVDIRNLSVGEKVYFRGNSSMALADGRKVTCATGAHCSHIVLNPNTTHGAAAVLPGADMNVACIFVMPAVGLYGVDMANPRMGESVIVYGAGLIGLGVVAACSHRGCSVTAIDINERQLEIAREFGADHTINGARQDVPAEVKKLAPEGADVVFECTGIPDNLDASIELCRTFGSFVWQGNYGADPVSIKFLSPHGRKLRMFFPCDDGFQPCRRAVVKNMAMGVLPWEKTITHRIEWADAPDMYRRINTGEEKDIIGVVIRWPGGGAS